MAHDQPRPDPSLEQHAASQPLPTTLDTSACRVLLVDDNEQNLELLAAYLEELRTFKQSKLHKRELDLPAALRISCRKRCTFNCDLCLKSELLSRAILFGWRDGEERVAKSKSFQVLDQMIDFLDGQPREYLRRGIFCKSPFNTDGSTPNVFARLLAYCRSRDIDLFVDIVVDPWS